MLASQNNRNNKWGHSSHLRKPANPWSGKNTRHQEFYWGQVICPEEINPVLIAIGSLGTSEDYDEDFLKPTESIFTEVLRLINSLYSKTGKNDPYPFPHVSADGDGGIRLRWVNGSMEVRLKYNDGLGKKPYIYHQQNDDYDVEYEVNSENLKKWLDWLIAAQN